MMLGHRQRSMMLPHTDRSGAAALRRELGRLEDRVAAAGWKWNAACSLRVDTLHIHIEKTRARTTSSVVAGYLTIGVDAS